MVIVPESIYLNHLYPIIGARRKGKKQNLQASITGPDDTGSPFFLYNLTATSESLSHKSKKNVHWDHPRVETNCANPQLNRRLN